MTRWVFYGVHRIRCGSVENIGGFSSGLSERRPEACGGKIEMPPRFCVNLRGLHSLERMLTQKHPGIRWGRTTRKEGDRGLRDKRKGKNLVGSTTVTIV